MTKTVNVHEAKTHLSRLLRRAQSGEEIVIARGGKPIARLVGVDAPTGRALGRDRGKFTVPEDFNAPLDGDLLDAFGA
jgi:prevent-host-death family protein